jgi:hypothetical protein
MARIEPARRIAAVLLVAGCAKGTPTCGADASPSTATPRAATVAPVASTPATDAVAMPDAFGGDCVSAPDGDICAWQREDHEGGPVDRVEGTDPSRAWAAMEARRAAVSACVARAQAGDPGSEELRRRVRVRARFSGAGRVVSALFQTDAHGYGYIDKFRHICIVDALGAVRVTPHDAGALGVVVTYTYTFDAGAGPP